jgi:integrase
MMAFHSMMDYAWRSKRIPAVPPFPKIEDYNMVEPTIKWLSEERQMSIINAIPEIHRPIFLWLKYHLRRPAEACALRIEDYDPFNDVFIVRRSISARKEIESTKTSVEHIIPCASEFQPFAIQTIKQNRTGHFFQNTRARRKNKRYTNESLNIIWRDACKKVGESIDLYSGLKHSSCSQYINEKGLSIYDLQALTDHARLDSVRKYAKFEVARKRELMHRNTKKVLNFKIMSDNS